MTLSTFVLSLFLVAPMPLTGQQTTTGSSRTAPAPVPVAPAAAVPVTPPPVQAVPATPPAAPADPSAPTTYKIGPEDEIRLVVVGEEQLTNVFRVQSDGGVSLPLIGTVIAQGLTTIELQDRIRDLLAKDWLRNPQVRAEVSKYGSQYVMVTGEVRIPGKVPMTGPLTLMEALAAAGSPTANASSEVTVARRAVAGPAGSSPQDATIMKINIKDLNLGVAGRDIPLRGFDQIYVPKAETFYVSGHVKNVGSQIWEPGLTVEQAVVKAGGLDDRGKWGGISVNRLVNGKLKKVDLKRADLVLPNDTITVPAKLF
jgi:polysaccharide biosynthesis/export protein